MGLINLQTNLRSVSWGGERPYITRDINNPPPSNILAQQGTRRIDDTQRILKMIGDTPGIRFVGNQALLLQTSIGDKVRDIKKRDGRSTGGAILQQIGNTVSETAGTLASTIAQTPVSGTGIRIFKGIAPKTYLQAGTNREGFPTFTSGDSVIGSQFVLSGRSENIPLTVKKAGTEPSSAATIRNTRITDKDGKELEKGSIKYVPSSEIQDDTVENSYLGKTSIEDGIGTITTSLINSGTSSGTELRIRGEKETLLTDKDGKELEKGSIKYVDNRPSFLQPGNTIENSYLGKTSIEDSIDTITEKLINPERRKELNPPERSRPLESTVESKFSPRDSESAGLTGIGYEEEVDTDNSIDRRNKNTSKKPYIGISEKGVGGINTISEKLNPPRGQKRDVKVDEEATKLSGKDENEERKTLTEQDLNYNGPTSEIPFPSSKGLSDFRKKTGRSYSLNYSDSNIRKESRVRLGNQGKKITINPDKLWTTVDQDTVDKLNALNVQDSSLTPEQTRDFISLNFEVITPDDTKYLYFRAYLDNFSDDYTGNWANDNYIGRGESMKVYEGFSRGVSLGFKVAASTRSEMRPIYEKINYLASATAPTYGDGTFMRGTIVRVTVGDYLHRVPAVLENVSFTWQVDYPWEVSMANPEVGLDDDMQVLPHVLDCSVTLGIIHNFIPQTGKVPYISNPNKEQAWTALPRETV